jgi:integrase
MLYRRKGSRHYWCRFRIGNREVRQSCGTADRKAAEEYAKILHGRVWREVRLGERSVTWEQAVARYEKDCAQLRPSTQHRNGEILAWFAEPLARLPLTAITPEVIAAAKDALVAGRSPATANRYLAVLRAVLNRSRELGWLRIVPKVEMFRLEDAEPRWLTKDEWPLLLAELPAHLKAPATFAVETGWRQGNVFGLTWGRVNLETAHAWFPASTAKGRRAIGTPLSPAAVACLKALPRVHEHVFVYRKEVRKGEFRWQPIKSPKTAFGKAVKRAGVAPFRWHDLRHTWASWLLQDGVPEFVVQKLGGWASGKMVERYGHLTPDDLKQWVARTKTGTAQ